MMKTNAFKRLFAAVMLISLVFTCFSCGRADKKKNDAPTETGAFLDITVKSGEAKKFVSDRPYDENKEDVTLILVTGQSNFKGAAGYAWQLLDYNDGLTDVYPDAPTAVPEGIAYTFGVGETFTDLDAKHDMNYRSNPERGNETVGGVTPSFAVRWNELTGSKVVFIQAAVGGTGIHEWVPNPAEYVCVNCGNYGKGLCYGSAVRAYRNAYNKLSAKYNIVYTGYIFNQGEHDEKRPSGCTVHDGQSYYDAYMKMHNGFKSMLELDFGGISVVRANESGESVRSSRAYTIARGGQYRLANNVDDIFMLSTISETRSKSMMDYGGMHYTQITFNQMGKEMAENLHTSLGLSDAKEYDGITVYGNGGHTLCAFDKNGAITEGKSVIKKQNSFGGVQVKLNTLGSAYTVDYCVTIDGKNRSKYIDDFGQIDWDAIINETGYSELTVRVTVK